MSRLILMIIFGFVAALYFPDSRQMMIDKAMPVISPVLVWSAEREMEEITLAVRRYQRTTYKIPTRRQWIPWLEEHFFGDGALDPWGSMYSYQAWADSFAIQSFGPDKQRGTADDLRISKHRPY